MSETTFNPQQAYQRRLESLQKSIARLDQRGAWLAHGRSLGFFGSAALLVGRIWGSWDVWSLWSAAALFLVFVVLAAVHSQVLEAQAKENIRLDLNQRGMDRVEGRWRKFSRNGSNHATPKHPYASDLNIFGQGSLFQLLDETATSGGEDALVRCLAQAGSSDQIPDRQRAVQELAPLIDFRQEVVVESRRATRGKPDPSIFIRWAEGENLLRSIRWSLPLPYLLPPATLALWLLHRQDWVPGWTVALGLALQLAVVMATRKPFARMHEKLSEGEWGFVRYGPAFLAVESQAFRSELLLALTPPFRSTPSASKKISQRLDAFSRWMNFADQRKSQFHSLLNVLLLWDVFFFFRLEAWRTENGAHVRSWFAALAELEALICLGGFFYDRPAYVFPSIATGASGFKANSLGHPLLDRPVENDVQIVGPSFALMVTGSNMSGKTTLLRAIGINAVLALAGAPVHARSMELSALHIFTSMRVEDSLEQGMSLFYAEVVRLKSVLDGAASHFGQALFLLDEILLGTNTKERQLASQIVLQQLLDSGAIGAVSTHDLSLADLAQDRPKQIRNVHFSETVEGGRMVFDYRLKEGVVKTTNALRVMAMAGIRI